MNFLIQLHCVPNLNWSHRLNENRWTQYSCKVATTQAILIKRMETHEFSDHWNIFTKYCFDDISFNRMKTDEAQSAHQSDLLSQRWLMRLVLRERFFVRNIQNGSNKQRFQSDGFRVKYAPAHLLNYKTSVLWVATEGTCRWHWRSGWSFTVFFVKLKLFSFAFLSSMGI